MGAPLGYTDRLTVCDTDDQVDLLMQIARKKGMEPTKPQARTLAFIANDWRENLGDRADLLDARRRPHRPRGARRHQRLRRRPPRPQPERLQRPALRNRPAAPRVPGRAREAAEAVPLHPGGRVPGHQPRPERDRRAARRRRRTTCWPSATATSRSTNGAGRARTRIPQFIRAGEAKTGKCTVVKLGLNYRSTPQIIETRRQADPPLRRTASPSSSARRTSRASR